VQIGTAGELAIAMDVMQGRADRTVLEQLGPHLPEIFSEPEGFVLVMRAMRITDQIFLIHAIGNAMTGVVKSARYLRDVLSLLATEEAERAMLEAVGAAGLRELLVTPQDLGQALEWVYGRNDHVLLGLLGSEHIREMIRNGSELAIVLNALSKQGQQNFLEIIGWSRVPALVHTGTDLAHLLRALPGALSKSLLDHFTRAQLVELIGNRFDWAYLYDRLDTQESRIILEKLSETAHAQ
jgi:hypothetical protein